MKKVLALSIVLVVLCGCSSFQQTVLADWSQTKQSTNGDWNDFLVNADLVKI